MVEENDMRKISAIVSLALSCILFLGCASRPQPVAQETPANKPKEDKMEFKLTSAAFKEGQSIPRQYTCDGVNVSPPLEWSGVPKTAKTFAIIADDPDAPGGTWVHWVLYNLPAVNIGVVENMAETENLEARGFQCNNDY